MNLQQIFHTAGGNFSAPNFKLTLRDLAGPVSGSRAGPGQSSATRRNRTACQNGDFSLIVFPKQRILQTFPQGSSRSRAQGASSKNKRRRWQMPSRALSSYHAPSRNSSSFFFFFFPPHINLWMQIKKGGNFTQHNCFCSCSSIED